MILEGTDGSDPSKLSRHPRTNNHVSTLRCESRYDCKIICAAT